MSTVFRHIVREHLSHKYEDIATDALAFILRNESARNGLTKFLRAMEPNLPENLHFRTQAAKGSTRPDMCGFDDQEEERVFIENKFWAALTTNQPANYLRRLDKSSPPTMVLIVIPADRWATMSSKLRESAEVLNSNRRLKHCDWWQIKGHRGRLLALTTWEKLLSAIKNNLKKERHIMNDLIHLNDLCNIAGQSFVPISSKQVKDSKIPSLILQLNSILDQALEQAKEKFLSTKSPKGNLGRSNYPDCIGRYIQFHGEKSIAWIGTEFSLWKLKEETPFWLVFEDTKWQRGREVRDKLEVWAKGQKMLSNWWTNGYGYDEFAIGIRLETNKDEADVISSVVNQLKVIATKLASISRRGK
jgi:hypothetical protein